MSPAHLTFACGKMMVNLWISLSALEIVGLQMLSQGKHHCIWNIHLWYWKIAGNAFAFQYGLNPVSYFNGWNVERSDKRYQVWDQVVTFPWEPRHGTESKPRQHGEMPGQHHSCNSTRTSTNMWSQSLPHTGRRRCVYVVLLVTHMTQNKAEWAKSIDFYTAFRTIILFSTFTALFALFVCLYMCTCALVS